MALNKYTYTVFKNTAEGRTEREGQGFKGGNISTDGSLVIGDIAKSEDCICTDHPNKPSYWNGDWPHMNHESALSLVGIQAAAEGGSDGWCTPEDHK